MNTYHICLSEFERPHSGWPFSSSIHLSANFMILLEKIFFKNPLHRCSVFSLFILLRLFFYSFNLGCFQLLTHQFSGNERVWALNVSGYETSFENMSKSGMTGVWCTLNPILLRNCHTDFHNGWTSDIYMCYAPWASLVCIGVRRGNRSPVTGVMTVVSLKE